MFLELTEVLVCPRCRPAQGLIALVDEIRDRRVQRGSLGCPECEARYPVREGLIRFEVRDGASGVGEPAGGEVAEGMADRGPGAASDDAGTTADDAALFRGVDAGERGLRLGALLGVSESEGHLLLGPGLEGPAGALAGRIEEAEVMAVLSGPAGPGGAGGGRACGGTGVTRLTGVAPGDLPVVSGRLGGVALLGGGPPAAAEAIRVLRHGGRLVIVAPTAAVREATADLPVEIVAEDEKALVGVRRR